MCILSSWHNGPFHGFQMEGHSTTSKVEWVASNPTKSHWYAIIYNYYLANFVAQILDVFVLINIFDFIM